MRKALQIALLYLNTTFRGRRVYIFSFAMPLLFTFVLGQATSGGGESPTSWPLDVVNDDAGALGANLLIRLGADSTLDVHLVDRETALAEVKEGQVAAALLIPTDFSAVLLDGQSIGLDFHANADAAFQAQIVEQAVLAATAQLSGSLSAAELSVRIADRMGLFTSDSAESSPATYFDDAFAVAEARWAAGAPVIVELKKVTRLRTEEVTIPDGVGQTSPGMTVMFALFLATAAGVTLILEREQGTLRRLIVMPMHKATILIGKLLGIYIAVIIQMAILILAGAFLFGVSWGQSPAALVLMVLSFALTSASLGMLLAAVARTYAQADALRIILVMSLASLGGAWWSIEIVPEWMQVLGHALPTAWAMDGFHDIITRGLGVEAVLPEVGVLMGFAALFLVIGVWRFRYE